MNNPEMYNQTNRLCRVIAEECLEKYSPLIKWKEGDKLIDLGCGDGSVTSIMMKYIPKTWKQFVCSDVNQKMLDYAKAHYSDERLDFRMLNVEGDTIPDDMKNYFNHAIGFLLMHWLRDQEKAFRNILNLLVNGGDVLLTVFEYVPIYGIYHKMSKVSKWGSTWLTDLRKVISHYYFVDDAEKELRKIMEAVGYVNITIQRKERRLYMINGTEMKNLIASLEPYGMPEDVHQDFLQDCVPICKEMGLLDQNVKTFEEHKDKIYYTYIVYIVHAYKP